MRSRLEVVELVASLVGAILSAILCFAYLTRAVLHESLWAFLVAVAWAVVTTALLEHSEEIACGR